MLSHECYLRIVVFGGIADLLEAAAAFSPPVFPEPVASRLTTLKDAREQRDRRPKRRSVAARETMRDSAQLHYS